jgi:very-short-patch-repair endonuclease
MAMPHSAITKRTRTQARQLRSAQTDAERKLWQLLRSLKPFGMHFRRQAPIGIYIADFAWHAGKIVVELDGSQHADTRAAYDAKRTAWLETQGYQVLRFWNNDVLNTPRSVGEAILATRKNPTPHPTPQGGGVSPRMLRRLHQHHVLIHQWPSGLVSSSGKYFSTHISGFEAA